MSREEAVERLASDDEVTYDDLDDIFRAFGFSSEIELPDATVYYHEEFIDCGIFRAQDRFGWGILSPRQRGVVRWMIECVVASERRREKR